MKSLSLIALLLVICTLLAACSGGSSTPADTTTAAPVDTTTATPVETTTAADTTTVADTTTSAPETTAPPAVDDGTLKTTVNATVPEEIKILAIGNSFSVDAMEYLYQMLKSAGVKKITLGNLYYGGCALDQHYSFARSDSASYKYYKNTTGSWSTRADTKMSYGLADEKWDYITMQQSSKTSGLANSYGKILTNLVDHVKKACPDATLIWHQTWAYQQDSTHSSFPNYGRDQMKMYNMIVDCVKNCIEPEDRFEYLIPCGTAVQNMRTSFLGDTLTRDGYHMDYKIGRYLTALTWTCAFTGVDATAITFNPAPQNINADMIKAAAEAVNNAIKNPYGVTESTVKTGEKPAGATQIDPSVVLDPADFLVEDTALAATQNIDLSKYKLLEWKHLNNTYYNSTSKAGTTVPKSSASTYNQNVCCDRKYSLTELPVGTVFICDEGWQYRLEKFQQENAKYTGTRPGMITQNIYVLDADFVADCQYFTWNIASNPKSDISARFDQAACHLRIYVPVK